MRFRSRHTVALLFACLLPLAAHANILPPTTYTLAGTLSDGGTVSGTFKFDSSTKTITAADFTAGGEVFTSAPITNSNPGNSQNYYEEIFLGSQYFGVFALRFLPSFELCTTATNSDCLGLGSPARSSLTIDGEVYVSSGSITAPTAPAAVTPEPSSLVLLGTGVLSLAGATRRRLMQA